MSNTMGVVQISDAEALIRRGVVRTGGNVGGPGRGPAGGTWADLGAGTGTFTRALANLLGDGAAVFAYDTSGAALAELGRLASEGAGANIITAKGDFTRPLPLSDLDGVVMANSLHFVESRRQAQVLELVGGYLRTGSSLVIVEYDQSVGSPWVPYPVAPDRFAGLARQVGLEEPREIGRRRSRYGRRELYAAVALKPSPM